MRSTPRAATLADPYGLMLGADNRGTADHMALGRLQQHLTMHDGRHGRRMDLAGARLADQNALCDILVHRWADMTHETGRLDDDVVLNGPMDRGAPPKRERRRSQRYPPSDTLTRSRTVLTTAGTSSKWTGAGRTRTRSIRVA